VIDRFSGLAFSLLVPHAEITIDIAANDKRE
jgi:hypothetical protein